jgi:hypothetical protein
MFHGTLPADAQNIVVEIVKSWNVDTVHVGCSGNMTIERGLYNAGIKKIHGNDVTIYSCAIGNYFAGNKLGLSPKEDIPEEYQFMLQKFDDDMDKLTTVLLLSKFQTNMYKEVEYYKKQLQEAEKQWPELIEKTKEKLMKTEFRLASFYAGDVKEFVDQVDDNSGFVSFPPFFSGDYEKMYANIESVIEWTPPTYEMLGEDGVWEIFNKAMTKKHWLFGTMYPEEKLKDHLVGICKTTNRGVPIYLYASSGPRRLVMPSQKIEDVKIPRLYSGMELGEKISIKRLTMGQFSTLRSEYMNANIVPGSPNTMWGVLVDGVLVGCFAYMRGDKNVNIESPYMYLLSDFPVSKTDYPRLSKLIVYCALCREMKEFCEQQFGTRMRSILTTAFSKRPVSMKYRGILKLYNRKKLEAEGLDGNPDRKEEKFQLNYAAPFGEWTLQEAYDMWREKHGKRVTGGTANENADS